MIAHSPTSRRGVGSGNRSRSQHYLENSDLVNDHLSEVGIAFTTEPIRIVRDVEQR